ncbi:Uncharacterised protein [Neisseria flavescens]|uniref:Uncharacterized protein n=1 Tax=Neisseria flavescens NRL30031/H210 TaxID=546264 RepID=C0ELE3_NEIFL|nr:hypothetical protein [Neisseria flavescens]EEG34107.1 hypothetical protein NEIFLAOT_00748 [Neisseria flavescens NRL30031/H210]SPY04171.1 Uncharacterised protein [Neisseria meningitidis]SPY05699.1 Uncharacterised protein [Neisseria meningitidis]STZ65838.1 Uncharacterised protein [Neisseria flavescens]
MSKQEKFFDVYVPYPPNTDRERIHACLYDNLPENEVESLIQALAERPQAIMAEKCSQDERENAQHYFSYLGLDVIVRQAIELEAVEEETVSAANTPDPIQCPICMTIIDELDAQECKTCNFDLTEKMSWPSSANALNGRKKSLSSIKNKPKLPTSSNMNASRKRKTAQKNPCRIGIPITRRARPKS